MEHLDNAIDMNVKEWIDSAQDKWRMQVLSKRHIPLSTKKGKRSDPPLRIRRFLEGVPAACKAEAIKYLLSKAPYTGVIFDGEKLPGAYRPTLTMWRRDADTVVNGQARNDGTLTLVQDLVAEGVDDTWSGATSGSCTEKVLATYVWDAADIQELPEPTQGVTYAIQNVNYDKDSGLLSYVLVERRAVTRVGTEQVVECSEFQQVTTTEYKNLYGTEGAFTDQEGAPVIVPDACSRNDGELIEVAPRVNDDCTYDLQVRRTTAIPLASERSTSKTSFEHSVREVERAQATPLPDAPPPADGRVVQHRSEVRPDGTYDNSVDVKQEQTVPAASVQYTKTRRAVKKTVIDRGSSTPLVTQGVTPSLAVGESRETKLTEGGLYDNTRVVTEKSPVGRVATTHESTIFEEVDSVIENVAANPGVQHVTPSRAEGTYVSEKVEVTEEGTFDHTVQTHKEKAVQGAVVTTRRTLRGKKTVTVDKGVIDTPSRVLKVGESLEVKKTNSGRYDVTKETLSPEPVGEIRSSHEATKFAETDATTSNVTTKPQAKHTQANNGKITTQQISATEEVPYGPAQ